MQYMAGASALTLVCFCLLCLLFLAVPAHASADSRYAAAQTPRDITPSPTVTNTPSPTDTATPSPTVTNTPSPTVTNTPSPTVTNTPSPTATSTQPPSPTPTTTPAPSPSATRTAFPSPTTTATIGATASATVAASPGVSPIASSIPTGTQGTGTNQGPTNSPTPANTTNNPAHSGAGPLASVLPFMLIVLGVIVLSALLFLPVRTFLRKHLIPLPSPNLPPSGAAPWSRAPVNVQGQTGQPFPFAQPVNGPFNAPTGAPFPGGFNAAPTQANMPANTWNNATPAASYPQSTPMLAPAPAFPGYASQAQPLQPFPAPPVIPTANGYAGLTQNQQPFPTTPPLLPGVQAAYASNQPAPTADSVPPDEPTWDADPRGDAFNNGTRKRLRRNGLRPSNENGAPGEQTSGEHSADRMVVSDPYLQALLRQNSQQELIVKQAPEESS